MTANEALEECKSFYEQHIAPLERQFEAMQHMRISTYDENYLKFRANYQITLDKLNELRNIYNDKFAVYKKLLRESIE